MRRLGIGALLGLHDDWRIEALALAAHAQALIKRHWRCEVSVSLPRLRPAAGGFEPADPVGDREFVQLLCAAPLAARPRHHAVDAGARRAARLSCAWASRRCRRLPHRARGLRRPSDAEPQFEICDDRAPRPRSPPPSAPPATTRSGGLTAGVSDELRRASAQGSRSCACNWRRSRHRCLPLGLAVLGFRYVQSQIALDREERALTLVTTSDLAPLRLTPEAASRGCQQVPRQLSQPSRDSLAVLNVEALPAPLAGQTYAASVRHGTTWISLGTPSPRSPTAAPA